MKKIVTLLIIFTMIASLFTVNAVADDSIKIVINGVEQKYDVMPVIINGRTLVPMRGIYEALGAEITWIDATKTVVGARDNKHIKLRINSDAVYVDGIEQEKKLDVPAQIINSRTMVPVRFIAESFGETVNWNGDTRTVEITSDYLKEVAVSDKLAHLDSRFHRPIPREFTKSSELGDWIYLDGGSDAVTNNDDLSLYGAATEMMTYDEFLNAGGFDEGRKTETSYGKKEIIDINEPGIKSTKAMRVVTSTLPPAKNLHVLLYGTILKGRFKDGDNVLLTFKARLTDGGTSSSRDAEPSGQIWASLQETEKYKKTIWQSFEITPDWQTMYIPAVMIEGYDDFAIRFGYCQSPQTVEIADFKLLNYGQELPRDFMLPSYFGKGTQELEPDAEWRKEAEKRIEQIRKGDFKIKVTDNNGNPVPNAKVTFDMYESELPFGSVYQGGLASKDEYKEAFSKYFNGTVMESNMKWGTFENDGEKSKARQYMTDAKKLGALYLRDHAILYDRHMHASTQRLIPDDVIMAIKEKNMDYVDERTKGWIYRISDLFAGEFHEIDVTNEISVAYKTDRVYKDKEGNDVMCYGESYYNSIGPQYYDKIFKWTREVNPDAKLCFTDTTTLIDPSKRKLEIYPILENLKKNPNTFDAIGIHGHGSTAYISPTANDAMYNDFYNDFGAVSMLTEYGMNSGDENYDANYTRDVFLAALANEHFEGIYLWGFKTYSASSEGISDKCFMDYDGRIKPTGEMMIDIIYNKMYTHNVTVTTDANGEATIRGFYGNYDVSIDSDGKSKKLMAAFHKGYENLLEVNLDDTMLAAIRGEAVAKEDVVENTTTEVFVPATTPEIKEEPKSEPKEEAKIEIPVDSTLPEGGEVILSSNDFTDMKYNFAKKFGSYEVKDGILNINVTNAPEKDQSIMITFNKTFDELIAKDDVCMLTFKVKVNSGTPYLKWQVQSNAEGKYAKALFNLTEVNGNDWVTCYMPFKGIANNSTVSVRLGGSVQNVDIKDFKLINYKSAVSLESLPSTIIK